MNKGLDKVGGHIHKAGGNALLPEYVPHQNTKTKTWNYAQIYGATKGVEDKFSVDGTTGEMAVSITVQ